MVTIEKPTIIVGTGRCGSTMLHRIIACHEDVGWISTFNEVFPTQPWLSYFSNFYRHELSDRIKHQPFFPKPFEAYKFWENYLPGFSRRDKPQTAEDVPAEAIVPVRRAVSQLLRYQNKKRFLAKVTGWSRVEYFDRIFPDALFIFLNREHRSVVSSWIQAGWLDVTSGIDDENWQWGAVPTEYRRIWEDLGGGPILSACVKIQLDLDDIRKNLQHFPDRSYKLQYEDLISRPSKYLRELIEFCELPWSDRFRQTVEAMHFYNPVNKWKKHLSEEEGDLIIEFFERAEAARKPVKIGS